MKHCTIKSLFIATIFLGSFLLFVVQPMIAKAILPHLGGSPSVWNVCMVTYQLLLLGGYGYAYVAQRFPKPQNYILVLLIALAVICLPIGITVSYIDATQPTFSLIFALIFAVGVPFFLLSSMSPLIQVWFSKTDLPQNSDPYFLYAFSNVGSLLALVSYPLIIERHLNLSVQQSVWSMLFCVYIVLLLGCRACAKLPQSTVKITSSHEKIPFKTVAYWTVLAFIPSSMMIGITTYITVDISPIPLFWVIPLGMYLLSYILAFSKWNKYILWVALKLEIMAVFFFITLFVFAIFATREITTQLISFFIIIQIMHSILATNKPSPQHLTLFYLSLSVGGALGGIFNALIAPVIFSTYLEYALVFLLAMGFIPKKTTKPLSLQDTWRDFAYPLGVFFFCFILLHFSTSFGFFKYTHAEAFILALICVTLVVTYFYPVRYMLMGAVLMFFGSYVVSRNNPLSVFSIKIAQERNFFGAFAVTKMGNFEKRLYHGTTLHGVQRFDPKNKGVPQTYYAFNSGLGEVFKTFGSTNALWRVGLVGLGVGESSAHAKPSQDWVYFEIDPAIAKLNMGMSPVFTYLQDFTPNADIKIGDGRVMLAKETKPFNIITLDAFSSDAIPTHLLTKEAVMMYLKHLTPDGILLFHVSNRWLDLPLVLSAIADDLSLFAALHESINPASAQTKATWVVVTPSQMAFHKIIASAKNWKTLPKPNKNYLWTDDFTNVLSVIEKPKKKPMHPKKDEEKK